MNMIYLNRALKEAKKAFKNDEVPVGAVIVKNDQIIATAYNKKEKEKCSIAHAEILAIKKACRKIGNWRLEDCEMYVTLDPCPMCAGAIKQSRIKKVYSCLNNSDSNNLEIITNIFNGDRINPSVDFYSNLSVDEAQKLLNDFFKDKRNK